MDQFSEPTLRTCPGFSDRNQRTSFWSAFNGRDGYIVPYRDEIHRITGVQLRRLSGGYETARLARVAEMYHMAGPAPANGELYLTEGATKAQVASLLGGITVLGVPGQSLQPEHIEAIVRLRPGQVIVALDQEANPRTHQARERWLRALTQANRLLRSRSRVMYVLAPGVRRGAERSNRDGGDASTEEPSGPTGVEAAAGGRRPAQAHSSARVRWVDDLERLADGLEASEDFLLTRSATYEATGSSWTPGAPSWAWRATGRETLDEVRARLMALAGVELPRSRSREARTGRGAASRSARPHQP